MTLFASFMLDIGNSTVIGLCIPSTPINDCNNHMYEETDIGIHMYNYLVSVTTNICIFIV